MSTHDLGDAHLSSRMPRIGLGLFVGPALMLLLSIAGCGDGFAPSSGAAASGAAAGAGGAGGGGAGGSAAQGGNAGQGGSAGQGSGPAGCVPSEAQGGVVDDGCGLFVSSSQGSDESGDGSKNAPYQSIAKALEQAPSRVYLCAESFDEAVALDASVELYGGLDCSDGWAYAGPANKTTVTAPADSIVLTVASAAEGSVLADLAVTARDAAEPGGSSIAALVDGAAVDFARCDLTAGDGAAGADGENPPPAVAQANSGYDGMIGNCITQISLGGEAVENPMCSDAVGGKGGDGYPGNAAGGHGQHGQPQGASNRGLGEDTSPCTAGTSGEDGGSGSPGAGGTALGAL